MRVTQSQIDAFKEAWEAKRVELLDDLGSEYSGEPGERTRAGLEAVAALRTHYQFGQISDTEIPTEQDPDRMHAVVNTEEAVLVNGISTVAFQGDNEALCILGIQGRINHSEHTIQAIHILGWEFAGFIIGELMKAATVAGEEAYETLEAGIFRSVDGEEANGDV